MLSSLRSKIFITGLAALISSSISVMSNAQTSLAYKSYVRIYAPFSPKRKTYEPLSKLCSESDIKAYSQDLRNLATDRKIFAWMQLGACGSKALPILIESLRKENYPEYHWSSESGLNAEYLTYPTILTLGQVGKDAVPFLIDIVKRGIPRQQIISVTSGESGYIQPITGFIQSTTGYLQPNTIVVQPIDELINSYNEHDGKLSHDAVSAAIALGQIGKNAKSALPELLDCNETCFPYSDWSLSRIVDKSNIPTLRKALKSPNRYIRCTSASALGFLGSAAKDAVPDLIDILKRAPHYCTIRALGSIGKDAKDAIPVFITILKKEPLNEDDNIKLLKGNILSYLGNIGQDARNTVPVLIEKLTEQLKRERVIEPDAIGATYIYVPDLRIIDALGSIGNDANAAVPLLRTLLQDNNDELRLRTALALWLIQRDTIEGRKALQIAISTAINTLEQEKRLLYGSGTGLPEVYNLSADVLTIIGIDAVPDLIKILNISESPISRYYAAIILGNIGFDARASIPILIEKVRDRSEDERVRFRAAEALGKIGLIAVPELLDALKDRQIRKYISFSLWTMQPSPFTAIEPLRLIVNDETNDLDTRRVAATTLDKLGVDMQSFFDKYRVLTPLTASCPLLKFMGNPNTNFYEFEVYSGKCIDTYTIHGPAAGGPAIWEPILNWFNRK